MIMNYEAGCYYIMELIGGKITMEDLYLILRDFQEVQYYQESILCILDTLENAYSEEEQLEMKMTIHVLKTCIETLQEETKIAIRKFDSYLTEEKERTDGH